MEVVAEHIGYKALYEAALLSNQQLQAQMLQLQYQLQQLTKMLQGFKSERFVPAAIEAGQTSLDLVFEQTAEATRVAEVQKKVVYEKKPSTDEKRIVRVFPAHLPVVETVLEPREDITNCKKIGQEITERLDWKPGELFVERIICNKYVCPVPGNPSGVRFITAQKPTRAIERSIAAEGLLAHLIIDKYTDHQPLNRQRERFKRNGVNFPDSTLADLVRQGAELIRPLGAAMLKEMRTYDYWHCDETGIKVLDRKKKKDTHNGYFWIYQAGNAPLVYYDYRQGRGSESPDDILKNFHGYLQVDGYGVYDHFDKLENITIFYCMAHARRKFFDSLGNDAERAAYALTAIKKLYEIESYCKQHELPHDQIRDKRQAEASIILNELGEWMIEQYPQVNPKSNIAIALAYSIKRWEKLSLYITDGKFKIDNNAVERSVKPVALGRKNFLFCGSHESAKRTALLYSLLVTCKLNNVNPYEWLKDVLIKISDHPINRIEELLPHRWEKIREQANEPAAV